MLKMSGWNVGPLIIIITWVSGVVHKQALKALEIPKYPLDK